MHDRTKPETQQRGVVYVLPSDDMIQHFAWEFCSKLEGGKPEPEMVREFAAFIKATASIKVKELNHEQDRAA